MKRKVVHHTVRPEMLTTSVYCTPLTVSLCPEQPDPRFSKGKERSLLLISKSTVPCRGSANGFESPYGGVKPVKFTAQSRAVCQQRWCQTTTEHCCRSTGRCHWQVRKVRYSQKGDVVRQYSSRMWQIYFELSCH